MSIVEGTMNFLPHLLLTLAAELAEVDGALLGVVLLEEVAGGDLAAVLDRRLSVLELVGDLWG